MSCFQVRCNYDFGLIVAFEVYVSILVFVELALGLLSSIFAIPLIMVSILVFVELALGPRRHCGG